MPWLTLFLTVSTHQSPPNKGDPRAHLEQWRPLQRLVV